MSHTASECPLTILSYSGLQRIHLADDDCTCELRLMGFRLLSASLQRVFEGKKKWKEISSISSNIGLYLIVIMFVCVAELFGGNIDWFSSSKLTPTTASTTAVSGSVWPLSLIHI